MNPNELWLIFLGAMLLLGIMSGVPVILAISGVPVLVAFTASLFGAFDLSYFGAFPQRIFGIMDNSLLVAVPLFILMGILLERAKVTEKMLLTMASFFSNAQTGLAYSVLIVSTLIAASTGIIGATIVMLAMISLPAMLKNGISVRLSTGLICASGTLGQIIPPSIVLILLGDQISNAYLEAQRNAGNFAPETVSVGDLFAGAIIPGLILVSLYAFYIFLHSFFSSPSAPIEVELPEQESEHKHEDELDNTITPAVGSKQILTTFLPPLLLIVAVLGSILMGIATATEAAAVGVCGTLLIAASNQPSASRKLITLILVGVTCAFLLAIMKSFGWTHIDFSSGTLLLDRGSISAIAANALLVAALFAAAFQLHKTRILGGAVIETITISAMVFGIIISASMLSLVFRGFGGDEVVEQLLSNIPGDEWGALLVVMAVIFLLGFVLEFIEIIFIVIPIVGPVLLAGDFHPVWFGILIAMNLQTSFLTPPFGFALFYFRSVAPKSIRTSEIYLSVIPFVVIQLLAILLLLAFPALATWLPSYIFN